jgi:hypothetical protein
VQNCASLPLPHASRDGAVRGVRESDARTGADHADKRKAVLTLLEDDEWRQWSNNDIARRIGVGHQLVNDIRNSLADSASEVGRTYTTKHGTTATCRPRTSGRAG